MPIANVPSVMTHGILSYERAAMLQHSSVAMQEVQDLRDNVQIPGAQRLHKYANLYFYARNPMMYKRHAQMNTLCVLRISVTVLDLTGVVLTDQNAASKWVRFLGRNQIGAIDFDKVFADDWRHPDDQIAYWRHKSIMCAEVLVPDQIGPEFIQGAYVCSAAAETSLRSLGFTRNVVVNPRLFFIEGQT